uniref:Alpha-type protein kinase domain-containing protein n=1 Tax=Alexandrium catenella TaxID=2925 RepID=A0A7S1R1W4_ALECA
MGLGMSTCTKLLFDHDLDYLHDGCQGDGAARQAAGPQLALKVAYAPTEDSLGAKLSPFAVGDEVAVMQLSRVKGWEPLGWRQERCAKQRAALDSASSLAWPDGPRFSSAQRFWSAKVMASDGQGGFEDHLCLLQVGVSAKDRSMESVKPIVDDANDVASYAHRFNMQTARVCGAEDEPSEAPGVRVCPPVGCFVLGSSLADVAQPGEAVALTVYPASVVKKFVFEGAEDFVELPQAFFHYVAWTSGGKEQVADLQGFQDDQDVILVDPVLLRAPKPSIGDLIGTLASGGNSGEQGAQPSIEQHRFDLWHPKCGQLCRAFDPQRRSAHARRACGLSLPSCGVGGA